MEIICPKVIQAITEIILQDNKSDKFKFSLFKNKFQKRIFIATLSIYLAGIILALIGALTKLALIKFAAVLFNCILLICAHLIFFGALWVDLSTIKNPLKNYLENLNRASEKEIPIILHLSSSFNKFVLQYYADRLNVQSEEITKRIGFLVGNIISIGLIPMTITLCLSIPSIAERFNINSYTSMCLYFVFFAFYFMSFFALAYQSKLKKYQLMLMSAASLKLNVEKKNNIEIF